MTPSTANLPALLGRIYKVISARQDHWTRRVFEINPPGTKPCDKCAGHNREAYNRQLFMELTICASAEHDTLSPRYEPCKLCFPRLCYIARAKNAGFIDVEPRGPQIDWHGPQWSKHDLLWRQSDKPGSTHAWVTRFADSRFTRWRDVEAMEDAGYPAYKRETGFSTRLMIDIDEARGEGVEAFLQTRLKCNAAKTTWIIGGTDALDPIIPEEFLRV